MAFKIKRSIPLLVVGDPKDPKDPKATTKTAKPVGIKSVKTTTPTPKISKAKPTVSKKVTPKPTTVTKQRKGYVPLADAEKMPGNSANAQALNTMNARDNKVMKADHLKADKNTKFPKIGDQLGLGHKIIGEDKESGDYFTRKPGLLPVYRVTRQNAASNARQSLVKISNRKIKHAYNKDGSLYERK